MKFEVDGSDQKYMMVVPLNTDSSEEEDDEEADEVMLSVMKKTAMICSCTRLKMKKSGISLKKHSILCLQKSTTTTKESADRGERGISLHV